MNPYTETYRNRRAIEDALAPLVSAEHRLRATLTRLVQRARTEEEMEDLEELFAVRQDIARSKTRMAKLHPDFIQSQNSK